MKSIQNKIISSIAALGLVFAASSALAQQYLLEVDKPDFDVLESPDLEGNTNSKNFKPKDWLEAEVKFKIARSSDEKAKFANKVTVRWYVAADHPEGKGYVLLKKDIDYINVPIGEDVYSSVYLSPTAILRLTGGDNAGKSILSHVGGEILVNGTAPAQESGLFTSKGKPGWWNKSGLTSFDSVPLLNKNETPFKFLWWDRYAEIEERN